ncbi:reverse transcriptase domain-containing protein [Tanacetum coccineum]
MKECIAGLPMVTAPKPIEELIMYLCVAREAISTVLLTERDSRQMPIYFVSRALQAPEINYNPMEKVVLALVHATRRLRRYFQAHPVAVVTDQPIKQILSQPENTERMLKWKFELEAFAISYRPRKSIHGQILANFIAEKPNEEDPPVRVQTEEAVPRPWTLFTDGSSCLEGPGAGLILTSPEGEEFTYALRFEFDASNNEVEDEALIAGLRIGEQLGVKNLITKVYSRLVANQINSLYKVKEQSMTQYLEKARSLIGGFEKFSIEQVSRSENKKADALSKIVSTSFAHLTKEVIVETLKRKSIDEREILAIVEEEEHCWMTPLTHRPVLRNSQQKLTPITSPWPFYKWGIDILGPFPETQGKVKFLIVAIDYFTKWVEAKPVATITGGQVKKFVWDNIVCRFGLPGEIISDNRKQFRDNPFKDWCEKLNIRQRLGENNKNWVKEVPHVLWARRIMVKTSNEDTPLALTYGTEAVIPVEIGMPSLRCAEVNQAENDEGILLNLDILEERREKVAVQEAKSKAKMEKYYNAKVRSTCFRPGDFVYRSNEASHTKESGKLSPKWEGPYDLGRERTSSGIAAEIYSRARGMSKT